MPPASSRSTLLRLEHPRLVSEPLASSRSPRFGLEAPCLAPKPHALSRSPSLRSGAPRLAPKPLASSQSPRPCLGVSRLILKPVALSQSPQSGLRAPCRAPKPLASPRITSLRSGVPCLIPEPVVSSQSTRPYLGAPHRALNPLASSQATPPSIQCPLPCSLSPIPMSNKNIENRLTSMEKKVEGIRSQIKATHQLTLELYARLGFTPPVTEALVATQPAHAVSPTSSFPSDTSLTGQCDPLLPPATGVLTRSKTFLHACRCCKNTDHWTKDCPHHFDVRYLSIEQLWKVLDNKRKSEGLPPLGPWKDRDSIIPIVAMPPSPNPKPSLTPSTSLSEGDLCCTPNPSTAASLETLVSVRHLPKGGAIIRATSPYLTLLPVLAPCVPTLRPVERPYIPPDLQTDWNALCPMGSFRFHPHLTTRWCISTMRPLPLC